MKKRFLLSLLLIFVSVSIYSNTFHVPFTFDDYHSIVLNTKIRSWRDLPAIWSFTRTRFLTYFTFALNYHFGGLKVSGYHLVNLFIHLACAFAVWSLVNLLELRCRGRASDTGFVAALIFLVHPVQIQAVTYIVQRAASLATLFYLLAIIFFLLFRLSESNLKELSSGKKQQVNGWYLACCLTTVAAMFTKEICFTLPLMLLVIDWLLYPEICWRRRAWQFIPLLLTLVIIPGLFALSTRKVNLGELGRIAEPTGTISPYHYLVTQFRVIVTYLRLLIFPLNQNLDYDYPVYRSFWSTACWSSFLILVALIVGGFIAYRRKNLMFTLAVIWFFLSLSVESSIYPIRDVIFEHRLYLPMVSYGISVALLFSFLKNQASKYLWLLALIMLVCGYGSLTYLRNGIWKSNVSLWADVAAKSPGKARAHHNYGQALFAEKKYDEAMKEFNTALRLDPSFVLTYFTRGGLYASRGQYQLAIKDFNEVLKRSLDKTRLAHVYLARGKVYAEMEDYQASLNDFNQAISLDSKNAVAYSERGLLFAKQGNYQQAIKDFDRALRLDSHSAEAYNNRGLARIYMGEIEAGLMDFRRALAEAPEFASVYLNLGLAYFRRGDFSESLNAYRKALEMDPNLIQAYAGMAMVYKAKGQTDKALEQLEMALQKKPEDLRTRQVYEKLEKQRQRVLTAARQSVALSCCEKGNYFREKGQLHQALEQYTLALKEDPHFAAAYYNRARTYQELGRNEEALQDYINALKYNPKDSQAWNNKGFLLDRQGNIDQAISDYSQAILCDRKNSQAYNNRGNAYFKKGEYEKAVEDYTHALELNPALAEAYRNRGMAYGKLKDYQSAALDFQKYLELNPDDPKKEALKAFINRHLQ